MRFIETVRGARDLLREEGRITLRGLKREFDLDDDALEELVEELVDAQQVAGREGKVVVWLGEARAAEPATSQVALPPAQPEAERRQLTVLFCDLVDSTALASQLDPEDWRDIVRGYQEVAAEVVGRLDGHVAQYLGDGLLVYFGYPTAHEDDAEHAVRAGLGIVEALAPQNPRLEEQYDLRLAVRIGIHTGPAVVGEMGGGGSRETLAMGDTTNVAARLQGIAEPDTVVLSPSTLRLVRGIFVTEDLGARRIKGLAEPLVVHRALQPSGVRSRLDLGTKKLTPFVSRQQELGMLLDGWDHICEGEGQTVLVTGEAGVGKSRLVRALRDRLLEEGHTWLECHCSPHTRNTALYPVIELVSQGLTLQEDESAGSKLRKLESGLKRAGLDLDEAVPLFAPLLSIPRPEGYAPLEMSPELQRRRTLEALAAWTLALADLQPVLLLIEDLHWCDPSSLELLEMLIEQCPTVRILTVLTARPEFEAPWPPRAHWSSLTLNRLVRGPARQMAASLSAGRPLPEEALDAIVARADGIPLYVEELTKAVLESELLLQREGRYELKGDMAELAIPMTLQDSLMSRLDRLPEAKQIAQTAAALGREFPYRLLAAVAQRDEPMLREGLTRLTEADILLQRGVAPNASYAFRHALIQDTAYESLLKSTRQDLHGRIADTFNKEFPDRAAAEPELVAHHYDRAGRIGEAIHHYQRAGDAARARSANAEAIAHLERGVELTSRLPEGAERDDPELRLQVSLGLACIVAHGYASEATGRAWERARDLCKGAGSPAQLAATLVGLSSFHMNRSELDAAMQFGEQLLVLGRRTKDESYVLAGTYRVGVAKFWRGRFRECLDDLNAALRLYDQKEPKGWRILYVSNYGVEACTYASLALWCLGYPDQAIARAEEGVERARTGDSGALANVLLWASACHSLRREWKVAARLAEECAEEAERRGAPQFIGISGIIRAHAIVQSQGRDTPAEAMEGLHGSAGARQRTGVPFFLSLVARVHQELGRDADALGVVESALAASEQGGQLMFDAELLQLKGELLLSSDEAEAEILFRRALEVAQRQEAKSLELRAATSLARLWQRQGKPAEARGLLAPVYDWFTEGFDTQDLKDAKALLDELT